MLCELLNPWENGNSRTTLVDTLGEVIDRQERLLGRNVDLFRAVL